MRSPSMLALVSIALGLFTPSVGSAQLYKDNTSPPIEVPTTPVPQGPTATTPPPAAKPPPKPAPAPPAAAPKAAPAAPPAESKGDTGQTTTPKYNNEGVFKISGSKGPGVVGGAKQKAEKPSAAPPPPAKGKTAAKGKKGPAPNVAQWPGFRLTEDGGSEVMVEFSSSPASPTEHRAAGAITYVFKGAHVTKSNNQNPLMTVHFNTPVLSARLVPKKGELHLVIDMRPGASAQPSSGLRASSDGDGQQFFVKFPSGAWLPKGAENEDIGPAPTQKLKNKPEKTDKKSDTPPPTTAPKTESGGKTGPAP